MRPSRGTWRSLAARSVRDAEAAGSNPAVPTTLDIAEFQALITSTYGDRDAARGVMETFAWFTEEVGELSRALRRGSDDQRREEFADVLAWLVSLAQLAGVDIEAAATARYGDGCPKCGRLPCDCR